MVSSPVSDAIVSLFLEKKKRGMFSHKISLLFLQTPAQLKSLLKGTLVTDYCLNNLITYIYLYVCSKWFDVQATRSRDQLTGS
jgi:hypothetical protein